MPTGSVCASPPPAALVTGGARRIGRAIVTALARSGYAVAIHSNRSLAAAQALRDEIIAAGGRAAVVGGDLAEHAAVAALVPAAVAAVGPLTLLINNASEFEPDEIGRLDRAQFDRHVAINLRAPLFLAQSFAAHVLVEQESAVQGSTLYGLVAQGLTTQMSAPRISAPADASIVNLLDQRVLRPTPRFLSYGLAKSALYAATTTLAQALAPRLRVNAVAPGPTLPSPRQDDGAFARACRAMPLGHGPSPEEIADAVLYLAGAKSVTGVTIAVDGGQHLGWRPGDAAMIEE